MDVMSNVRVGSVLLAASVLVGSCIGGKTEKVLLPIAEEALYDTTSVHFVDFDAYPSNLSQLPIGVLDFGDFGFEMVESLLSVDVFDNITGKPEPDGIADFAGEDIQLITDPVTGPWDNYAIVGKPDELRRQAVLNSLFLVDNSYYNLPEDIYSAGRKERVKILVVASPTADLMALDDVRNLMEASGKPIRVVGVMESAIDEALSATDHGSGVCVGVLLPPDGISSLSYDAALRHAAGSLGKTQGIHILTQEAYGLAEAIRGDMSKAVVNEIDASLFDRYNFNTFADTLLHYQEGQTQPVSFGTVENYVRYQLVSMVERHRRSSSKALLSSIILADGTYVHVKDIMEKVIRELYDYRRGNIYLYRNVIAPDFRFIDPAESAARTVYRTLREEHSLALSGEKTRFVPFIMQGDSSGFKPVPFAPKYMSREDMDYIELNTPTAYTNMRSFLY